MENKMKKLFILVLLNSNKKRISYAFSANPINHIFHVDFMDKGIIDIDDNFINKYNWEIKCIAIDFQEGNEEIFFKLAENFILSFEESEFLNSKETTLFEENEKRKLEKFICNKMFLSYELNENLFKW